MIICRIKNTMPSTGDPTAVLTPANGKMEEIAGITIELAIKEVINRMAYFSRRITRLITANAPITPATSNAVSLI